MFGPRFAITFLVLYCAGSPAHAWGPHTEITRAALDVLPNKEKLQRYLGADWQRIAKDYCWMADWREAVRPDHYADDYLLFPGMPTHLSHMLPEVRRTYAPFFRRALQAVRTESPANAARWVGSLLHFVQDSGSPPHTTGIVGPLHGKMEQWVDESKIAIASYKPRLLGKTENDALRGFQGRMDGLVAFSRLRAVKLKPILEKLDRRLNQPLELESALEVARVTADVVHTLFALGQEEGTKRGAVLEGSLGYRPPAGYATVPAKVMLVGTTYSTTTDAQGGFRFRNLPPGKHQLLVLATGYESPLAQEVVLKAGQKTRLAIEMKPDPVPGNLVRNPRFQVRWIKPEQPDGWARDPGQGGRWVSALIRVAHQQKCLIRVVFADKKKIPVFVRWRANPASLGGSREAVLDFRKKKDDAGGLEAEVMPDRLVKPFEKEWVHLEVLVETEGALADACRHIAVTYVKKKTDR